MSTKTSGVVAERAARDERQDRGAVAPPKPPQPAELDGALLRMWAVEQAVKSGAVGAANVEAAAKKFLAFVNEGASP